MARTSQRLSSSSLRRVQHKRVHSASALPSRTGKKPKTAQESDHEAEGDGTGLSPDSEDTDDEVGSDFGADDASATEQSEDDEDDDEEDYESDHGKSKARKRKSIPQRSTPKSASKPGSDVWREGVSAGLGPGKQVIIKKPKARGPGKIPYRNDTLHPNTFLFLADLKANNERQWLKMNDLDFRQSEKDWFSFVESLTERLVEIDETVPELPVKDVIFRIYRDVRFSPDPTPYKPHFSAAFSRTGRKGPYAHYYVQIGSEESFVGGGLWHPEAAPLAALRHAIDGNSRGLKDVLLGEDIRREFLKNAPKNDAKVVKAFTASNAENALKTKPKGYDADHPDIGLLRLRNYTIGRKLTHKELVEDGLNRVAELLACMRPFITYLNSVVMPDPADDGAGSASSDEELSV